MREVEKLEFEWDEGNLRHIVYDHPERDNTVEEVESIWNDPYFRPIPDRFDYVANEQQFSGVGIGNAGIEKHVVFVWRNGKIRPFSCRKVKPKVRRAYHQLVKQIKNEERGEDG